MKTMRSKIVVNSDAKPDSNIDPAVREAVRQRLRCANDHLENALHMLEGEDADCVNVLKQINAINDALAQFDDLILYWHVKHRLTDAHDHGDREAVVAELMDALEDPAKR